MTDFYLVGGAVRDLALDVRPHDFDFTVANTDYDGMRDEILALGGSIWLEKPEYGTVRAKVPAEFVSQFFDLTKHSSRGVDADFVLARKDGYYSDGRRPDSVEFGSLYDDLSRRDFTVNAMALDSDRKLIDPFGGLSDLNLMQLVAVGDPVERLAEDALRVLRAIRFDITKGFRIPIELAFAMNTIKVHNALDENIAAERIRDELELCFRADPWRTMRTLTETFPAVGSIVIHKGIWFKPTMEKR